MSRRSLEDGIGITGKSIADEARDFVRGDGVESANSTSTETDSKSVLPQMVGRKSLTIKLHPQVASDLKRLSLERQLNGIDPHTMQDMAEEAITAWLRKNS